MKGKVLDFVEIVGEGLLLLPHNLVLFLEILVAEGELIDFLLELYVVLFRALAQDSVGRDELGDLLQCLLVLDVCVVGRHYRTAGLTHANQINCSNIFYSTGQGGLVGGYWRAIILSMHKSRRREFEDFRSNPASLRSETASIAQSRMSQSSVSEACVNCVNKILADRRHK